MVDLEVFPAQLRANRGTQQIDLSLRDVKILQPSFQQRGKVVDRDSFLTRVGGATIFPTVEL